MLTEHSVETASSEIAAPPLGAKTTHGGSANDQEQLYFAAKVSSFCTLALLSTSKAVGEFVLSQEGVGEGLLQFLVDNLDYLSLLDGTSELASEMIGSIPAAEALVNLHELQRPSASL